MPRPLVPTLLAAALVATLAAAPVRATDTAAAPALTGEDAAVFAVVRDAMAAGFEGRDLDRYLRAWAADARMVVGRAEAPGPYDVALDRAALAASKRLLFATSPPGTFSVALEDPRVERTGDRAVLRTRTVVSFRMGAETVAEIYRLRRTADGWRIVSNRVWPVAMRLSGQALEYGPAYWKTKDAEARQAEAAGDVRDLTLALLQGYRFREALVAARLWTRTTPDAELAWHVRARAARQAGKIDEARTAMRRLHELDPTQPLPPEQ